MAQRRVVRLGHGQQAECRRGLGERLSGEARASPLVGGREPVLDAGRQRAVRPGLSLLSPRGVVGSAWQRPPSDDAGALPVLILSYFGWSPPAARPAGFVLAPRRSRQLSFTRRLSRSTRCVRAACERSDRSIAAARSSSCAARSRNIATDAGSLISRASSRQTAASSRSLRETSMGVPVRCVGPYSRPWLARYYHCFIAE